MQGTNLPCSDRIRTNHEKICHTCHSINVTHTPTIQVFSDYFNADANVRSLFHQYEASENDRARYSLACQLDGKCPVNFRDDSAAVKESR